ncbi:MAG: hypothetical protein AVDCRST_MAG32-180 [uncultured Nocardioides sp.]|uniref:Putative glutamate--cysteine ligase 2 n=1 Tax=uncultured Nocardioides sp. TaxID=198441 RepID=A0A6J4MSK4_9ACTN|nr:MAG: hypothetical protein AVDCRST_MAG32-180 [uncultured Nocardioides sp.]
MRSMGVEEELILLDPGTGEPRNLAAEVVRVADAREKHNPASDDARGGTLGHELQKSQIETDNPPLTDLGELEESLRAWRERARASALEVGARVLASGTSPLSGETSALRTQRFDAMAQRYGLTLAEQLICGCHVHVDIESPEEGVGVLDRIRSWLPLLLAISANSPWWQGRDTAYESYRSQIMVRWPSAGPTPYFGTPENYRSHVDAMLATGVLLDEAMVYTDARLSALHPTVEIRTADVCLDVRDAVLVAALCRAMVETAAREWAEGVEAPRTRSPLIRLATWKAGRYGLTGDLVDFRDGTSKPAADVLAALLDHVDDALGDAGDRDHVHRGIERLLAEGTGAQVQRRLLAEAEGEDGLAFAVRAMTDVAMGQ